MTTWALELRELDGTVIDTTVDFRDLHVRWVLDAPGAIDAKIPYATSTFTDWSPMKELRVTRDATRIFGGYLDHRDATSRDRESASVSGRGYADVLYHNAYVANLTYDEVPQQDIAWGLIAHLQGLPDGNFGFTQGTHVGPDRDRSREFCGLNSPDLIGPAIEDLTGHDDAFDWEISATKAFNTWAPGRGTASGITFTGADETELSWEEDVSEAASYVTARGDEDCNPRVLEVSNAAAIARFKRRHVIVDARTNRKTEVNGEAAEVLRERRFGMFRATVTFAEEYGPAWGTWWLGDTVTLSPAEEFQTFTKTLRIVEVGLTLEDPDNARVELVLDAALT